MPYIKLTLVFLLFGLLFRLLSLAVNLGQPIPPVFALLAFGETNFLEDLVHRGQLPVEDIQVRVRVLVR